jgi:hypothetical protein
VSLAVLVIIGLIVTNFNIIPPRSEVIKMKSDIEKFRIIDGIILAISRYYIPKHELPNNLKILLGAEYFSNKTIQKILQKDIVYKVIDNKIFEICANFSFPLTQVQANTYFLMYDYSHNEHDNKCMIFNAESFLKKHRFTSD